MKHLKFDNRVKPDFYSEMKEMVNQYFKENKIGKYANTAMVLKSILFLLLFILFYMLIIAQMFNSQINLLLAMALGITQTFIAFNISHDALHGSYSSSNKINKLLGYTYDVMGLNSYIWRITHNKVHHKYTNIPGHDEDLDIAPGLIRLSPKDELKPHMKFQPYYAFLLYLLTSISWILRKDFKKMFQEKIGETKNNKHPLKEYIILFLFKGLYGVIFIVLPLIIMDIKWWEFLIGFIFMHFAEGIVAALVFQLAHTVEDSDYSYPDENWQVEESWTLSQMKGTANFSINNSLATFFFGGLNYQIEHHLFPSICHIHYPALSKIVRTMAKKHKVTYNLNPTFFRAIISHHKMLKKFSTHQHV